MAEMQIQLFLLLSTAQIETPTSPENYHLLHSPTSRIQYGVDYSTYMAQLAKDMGSAPSLRALMVEYGWFVTFLYWYVPPSSSRLMIREVTTLMVSFGAAFPTFYRLVGPYRSPQAEKIVKTELWDTIKRRGVIGNIFMGVIPMVRSLLIINFNFNNWRMADQ
jgi:dimethylaniline monooxygenase (N-oxide forming)